MPCRRSADGQMHVFMSNSLPVHLTSAGPGNDILRDVISQCSASRFVQQNMAHQRSGWPCMTSVMLPGSLAMTSHLDDIPQCSASQLELQHPAHLGIKWPCTTSIKLPLYRAMTYILDVILQCSASQFVQQHMAHLRIRWPCMTSVMLPVYPVMTPFHDQDRKRCNCPWIIWQSDGLA